MLWLLLRLLPSILTERRKGREGEIQSQRQRNKKLRICGAEDEALLPNQLSLTGVTISAMLSKKLLGAKSIVPSL